MMTTGRPGPTPTVSERHRDSLFLLARLRFGEADAIHEARVRNLSEGGMMAEFDRAVELGSAVAVELRGVGTVSGRIAWAEQGRIGVSFDRPIDPKAARKPVGGGGSTPLRAKAPPRR